VTSGFGIVSSCLYCSKISFMRSVALGLFSRQRRSLAGAARVFRPLRGGPRIMWMGHTSDLFILFDESLFKKQIFAAIRKLSLNWSPDRGCRVF